MSDNVIARLRRAASKVMPEDYVRVRMTAHDADFLADGADGYRAISGHLDRMPLAEEYEAFVDYMVEYDLWLDVLKDWNDN